MTMILRLMEVNKELLSYMNLFSDSFTSSFCCAYAGKVIAANNMPMPINIQAVCHTSTHKASKNPPVIPCTFIFSSGRSLLQLRRRLRHHHEGRIRLRAGKQEGGSQHGSSLVLSRRRLLPLPLASFARQFSSASSFSKKLDFFTASEGGSQPPAATLFRRKSGTSTWSLSARRSNLRKFQIPGAVNDGVTMIPNAGNVVIAPNFLPRQSNLCGNNLGLPGKTVCSEYFSTVLVFWFFLWGSLVSKDGRSDISRILMPSPSHCRFMSQDPSS